MLRSRLYQYLYEQRSSAANRIPYLRKEEDRVLLAEGESEQPECMASGQLCTDASHLLYSGIT